MLYGASDSSSIAAQKKHFLLVRARIALLLVIAGVTSFAWNHVPNIRTFAAIAVAIFLVVSMAVSAILDMKKFDRIWFSSRAIAESVKTESWRFMTKAEPYDSTVPDSTAEALFLERLDYILHRQPSVCPELSPYLEEGAQITDHMKQMRKKPLEDRRAYYFQDRIRDQRLWYTAKAKWNHAQQSRWFIATWILQITAAAIAIMIISFSDPILNPVGILTTAGGGVLSWIHARSYRELSQSYSLIAQELSLLEARANQVTTEEELSEIVLDVERTISREHAMWLTRRLRNI